VAEAATRSLSMFMAAIGLYLGRLYIILLCMSRGAYGPRFGQGIGSMGDRGLEPLPSPRCKKRRKNIRHRK
jgi:hypothetical protein